MLTRRSVLVAIGLVLVVSVGFGDTKVEQMTHTDAVQMMGRSQPATDTKTVTWFGKEMMAAANDENTMIIRLDRKKAYIVNHGDKTYSELDLPIDPAKLMPPGMAEQMAQFMNFDVTVTPTDEYKQIGEWRSRRYNVDINGPMMQTKIVAWATTEIDIDISAAKEMSNQLLLLQPGMDAMAKEMKKIEGFQIASESVTSAMGAEIGSSTKTLSVVKGDAPAGTYEVPAGYKLVKFEMKMGGR
jgi:hypothetical protein